MIIRIILVRIITILSSDGSDGLGRRRSTDPVMTGGSNREEIWQIRRS